MEYPSDDFFCALARAKQAPVLARLDELRTAQEAARARGEERPLAEIAASLGLISAAGAQELARLEKAQAGKPPGTVPGAGSRPALGGPLPSERTRVAGTPSQKVGAASATPSQKVGAAQATPSRKVGAAQATPSQKVGAAQATPSKKVGAAQATPSTKAAIAPPPLDVGAPLPLDVGPPLPLEVPLEVPSEIDEIASRIELVNKIPAPSLELLESASSEKPTPVLAASPLASPATPPASAKGRSGALLLGLVAVGVLVGVVVFLARRSGTPAAKATPSPRPTKSVAPVAPVASSATPRPPADDGRLARLRTLASGAVQLAREKSDFDGAGHQLADVRKQLLAGEGEFVDAAEREVESLRRAAPTPAPSPVGPAPSPSPVPAASPAPTAPPTARDTLAALRDKLDPALGRLDLAAAEKALLFAAQAGASPQDLADLQTALRTLGELRALALHGAENLRFRELDLELASGARAKGTLERTEGGALVLVAAGTETKVKVEDLAVEEVCALARTNLPVEARPGYSFGRALVLYFQGDAIGARRLLERAPAETSAKFRARIDAGDLGHGSEPAPVKLGTTERPLSSELSAALKALAGTEPGPRLTALESLVATLDEESGRVERALLGPASPARTKLVTAVAKVTPDAADKLAKVPEAGSAEPALVADLAPAAEAYVEKVARPAALAAVRAVERKTAEDRNHWGIALRSLAGEPRSDAVNKKRELLLAAWVKVRDAAVDAIFDKTLYPDENHGKPGQKAVDDKVSAVRDVWKELDPVLMADAGHWHKVPEAKARELVSTLDDLRARRAACLAFLAVANLAPEHKDEPKPPADEEAFLRHRAGQHERARFAQADLAPYARALLDRLRDLRALEANEALLRAKAADVGVLPTADEVEEVRITNEYRMLLGRTALEIDGRLVAAARGHSEEMTRLNYFDHVSPVEANKTPVERMHNAGYNDARTGENITQTMSGKPTEAHKQWYNSSGHHRGLLSTTWVGMAAGRDAKNWTQNFGAAPPRVAR